MFNKKSFALLFSIFFVEHILFVPGWTQELNLAREQSLFWHIIWDACERPREGEVADVMRHARNRYHYLIRRIKKNSDLAVRRSLGNALLREPSRHYWTEVKKIHKNKSSIQNKVDDKTVSVDIANAFADQYSILYSSVHSEPTYLSELLMRVKTSVRNIYQHNYYYMQHCHFVNSTQILLLLLVCYLMNMRPPVFLYAAGIPIPKNTNLNLSSSCNYRALALSSIFSKILDKIMMSLQSEYLMTSELQFGFEEHSSKSTIMCSTLLVETVEYYVSNNSTVYVLLIDASKAFDILCHSKLFEVLGTSNVCPLVRRLLYNIYSRSEMHGRWNSVQSTPFSLNN